VIRFSSLVKLGFNLGGGWFSQKITAQYPRILMYHRFHCGEDNGGISADSFERQVAFLSEFCECLTISDLTERIKGGGGISRGKPVACVTVDDGYSDFYDVAFPILEKYQVPATFYVTTGFVDGTCWLWYDRLKWIVENDVSTAVIVGAFEFQTDEWNQDKTGIWSRLVSDFLKKDGATIERYLRELEKQVGVDVPGKAPSSFKAVTWDQLRDMQEAGIEIGGHTVNHYSLGRLARENVFEELESCRNRLTEELGRAPRAFCFPNGQPADVPADHAKILRKTGFDSSVVAYYDKCGMADLHALRRHGVGDGWYGFQKTILGVDRLGAVLLGRNNVFDWGEV
jgi:peptidoglycan/xylan/chitin deacetylase (PgdA/CDA1 family)